MDRLSVKERIARLLPDDKPGKLLVWIIGSRIGGAADLAGDRAWTTWSGCAGRTGSNAPSATALEAGGRVIAGSCAPPAGTGPR